MYLQTGVRKEAFFHCIFVTCPCFSVQENRHPADLPLTIQNKDLCELKGGSLPNVEEEEDGAMEAVP